ncbi:Phosphopantothenate--cysteine ligase cab2 [Microbotryomycetes sp. JL201]|nr:Phosphopantothenate--cysteine ligase cab2 [Microbotryomycetes sp. JL201]
MASNERPLFSAEQFFAEQPPPARLDEHLQAVERFVKHNASRGKRVVLVTSGGTTVPLEHNVVRFLDNFSAGTRGAASAEHFLRTGDYAVIFMHRQHSLQPFSRHYSHSTNPFLDLLTIVEEPSASSEAAQPAADGFLFPPIQSPSTSAASLPDLKDPAPPSSTQIHISPPHLTSMLSLLRSYQLVKSQGLLHSIPFTTIDEYLFLLRGVSRVMGTAKDDKGQALGRRGMYYLAAAVSDFFIPSQRMSEHKIQSGKGSLVIEMDQVPKVLKNMVDEWSNQGFIVSFKLETDTNLLIPKARTALERYGHQVVIGNLLHDRKYKVVFVDKQGEQWLTIPHDENEAIKSGQCVREIEHDIVERLRGMHSVWIESEKR